MTVNKTAIISATGSARNTENVFVTSGIRPKIFSGVIAAAKLSGIIAGNIKINGIRRIIFLNTARKTDIFASPKAINVCWQAICAPSIHDVAI